MQFILNFGLSKLLLSTRLDILILNLSCQMTSIEKLK